MATIDTTERAVGRDRIIPLALGALAVCGVVLALWGLRRPPQMGAHAVAFHTVDALYTAVRMEDAARLGECERRLRGYREAGQLPAAAAAYLDDVIRTARAGRWSSAAEALYDFMRGQRREGADAPRPKPAKSKARLKGQ